MALTIGSFDGVHLGHVDVIQHVVAAAKVDGSQPALITFEPHPRTVLDPANSPQSITTLQEKLALIEATGIQHAIVMRFDRELASLSPQEFIDRLSTVMDLRRWVIGYDFAFGRGRTGSGHWLREHGHHVEVIPPFLVDGHPDKRPWTGGCGHAWWWHTEHDTLDKADVAILATDVKVGLAAVWGLANATYLPLDYRATARELIDVVHGLARAAPGIDFAPLLADAQTLLDALETFEGQRGTAGDEAAAGWNAVAIRLGRILNPVMYTRGGRFQHDPAEWSPILRATTRFTMPGLNRAESLAALEGTAEHGFLEAQLVREVNRARAAVREATQLVSTA